MTPGGDGGLVRIGGGGGSARWTARDGRPTTTKTIAPTTPVSTITSSQTSLLLALNDRIVRDLDHIDEGPDPDDESGQCKNEDDDDDGSIG
jgi:hypothetical protein